MASPTSAGANGQGGDQWLAVLPQLASLFGNILGGNSQADAADRQLRQAQHMYDTEQQLRGDYTTWLQNNFNNFGMADMPNANNYFGNENINKQYDVARQNLNYNMNQNVADASAQAGALAGARGLANKSGFVNNSANQVRASFTPQFGQLEQSRAGALNQNQMALFNALLNQSKMKNDFNQNRFQNASNVANFRLG